VTPVKKERTM